MNDGGFDIGKIGFDEKFIDELLGIETVETKAQEYETSTVADRFWITIKGPLTDQAKVLDRMKEAMADLPLVSVEIGFQQLDG